MVREYILQGLGCANCAAKIESAVKARDGVNSASVNFATATLRIDFADAHRGDFAGMIKDIVHEYEPDVAVVDKNRPQDRVAHAGKKSQIIVMIAGAAVFGAGILLKQLSDANSHLQLAVFLAAYLMLGGKVLRKAAKNILRGRILDENFLMSLATVGAFAIGEYPEAAAVMLFYRIGEHFQESALRRSKKSIADLMDLRPDFANLKTNGEIAKVAPETVKIGDVIVIKPGEKIPLDGIVAEGESMLDTMALTGESALRRVSVLDTVLSGCINQNGLLAVEVTKTFGESTAAKIIGLVEGAAGKKAPAENFITKFSKYYTPAVAALAVLIAMLPPLAFGGVWGEWLGRGLVFLVISCPCALVISIPLGFFGGIGAASKKGILVKGGNYLEALNRLETVVFDKTGTLTKGVFEVTKLVPADGFSDFALLETAAKAETFSTHPIASSVMKAYGKQPDRQRISGYTEISGQGVGVVAEGKKILAGNETLMRLENIEFLESGELGTKIYVAVDGIFAGCIVISDEIKEDSREAIGKLKAKGINKTAMLTGDNAQIAEATAKMLNLDEVHSGLLPDQKVEKLEMLIAQKTSKGKLAFVGDGINDAPVLARADVGIAMGALGSDAAIEAADVVLMTDEPSKLAEAIDIAKFTRRIVWQNIVFALGVKGAFLLLGALGAANMWEAVFADVGVSLLAVLNSMRAMRAK